MNKIQLQSQDLKIIEVDENVASQSKIIAD